MDATIRRLLAFHVDEHNRVLPHSAFLGQTPNEMYIGIWGRSADGPDVTPGRPSLGVLRNVPSLNAAA